MTLSFNKFSSLPVVLLLTTKVKLVILGEGQFSIPVCQLQSKSVLPLIGQLVHQLISQPMLSSQTPKALKYTNTHLFFYEGIGTFHWLLLFKHITFCKICSHPVGLGVNNHGGIYLKIMLFCTNYSIWNWQLKQYFWNVMRLGVFTLS